MKWTITVEKEIEVRFVRISVPVRYGTDDMPEDFPGRAGDCWEVVVDIDTGKILDWPGYKSWRLCMKVVDGGTYDLLDRKWNPVARLDGEYVPHGVIPGSYGDYLEFTISKDGTIEQWSKHPDLSAFGSFA